MKPGGLLVVTAHPDDETLIAGGVLAACAAAGRETGVVCLTRGEYGPIADASLASAETLAEVREAELLAACGELGVSWVRCFRRQDAHLPWTNSTAIARQIARAIEARRPAAVITFGEEGLYYHPDHVAVHGFTHRAMRFAAEGAGLRPRLYESVWPASAVPQLVRAMRERGLPTGLWDIPPSDFGVHDLSGVIEVDVRRFLPSKLRALRKHQTQIGSDHLFSALPDDLATRFLGRERFRRVLPRRAPRDWLTAVVEGASQARPGSARAVRRSA
jgi:N-acetyl-1-D-myo-inositol-2-amino-2-deoxy-alpha-D-glucopyranoside deacetylase